MSYQFIDWNGTFRMEHPEQTSYLYLPIASPNGVMSCVTPDGHGDSKLSQEHFLMEPVSIENLHQSESSRNFWCQVKGYGVWSAMGYSAEQNAKRYQSNQDKMILTVGAMWQESERLWSEVGLCAKVRFFCPTGDARVEIMSVTLENRSKETLEIVPTVAVPIFARGADHIRDHRHVTSLLNHMEVTEDGVLVTPSMAFDEHGHHKNEHSYGVFARTEDGEKPLGAFLTVEEFIGEGGNLAWPRAVVCDDVPLQKKGTIRDGYEAMGALRFAALSLKPQDSRRYLILLSYDGEGMEYLNSERAEKAFEQMQSYWEQQKTISVRTGDSQFDNWMQWVNLQPTLRKIYGCSFLPHHDYGRGGRGWRDLWQDCLALLLRNPKQVREDLKSFFCGVRADGSNATIIGSRPGEFQADRNHIVRVWMDHGYWPFLTVNLYLQQTGDYSFLLEETSYFKDQTSHRGERVDVLHTLQSQPYLKTAEGEIYQGSILEHLLIQQVTQFYDVGEHNHMRLRGADWNDALDMAKERGESVAFTAAYSGSLSHLADALEELNHHGVQQVWLACELDLLLNAEERVYDDGKTKKTYLYQYCEKCCHTVSGKKQTYDVIELASRLRAMSHWIQLHIRRTELLEDGNGNTWFNGYYDNHGRRVEGVFDGQIRMMLTGQVFSILSGTATDEQVSKISHCVDRYLYEPHMGGYRLNTDFHEVKLDLGRMFGFAYGHKENGAVFCHMAVMYAYALYERGFVNEGYRVIDSLFSQSMDFSTSRIYPNIPEYFNEKGRGMYSYLTGAASWLVLTVLTQMYGVCGNHGNLILHPQLLLSQFDEKHEASIRCYFAGKQLAITYVNPSQQEFGDYEVEEIFINGVRYKWEQPKVEIARTFLESLPEESVVDIRVLIQ